MERYPYKEPELQEDENQEEEDEETMEQKGLKVSESWYYKIFVKSAYRLINKPLAVFRLLKQALARIRRYESVSHFTSEVRKHLGILIRMVYSYTKGEYRGISVQGVALTVAALLYFVAPIDLIPDFLAIGLIDDIALLTWVFRNYRNEIDDFLKWEDDQKVRIELPEELEEDQVK